MAVAVSLVCVRVYQSCFVLMYSAAALFLDVSASTAASFLGILWLLCVFGMAACDSVVRLVFYLN